MMEKIIVSGFGGQGVMLIGQILAYAGMKEEKEVSWLPSYGPEMRGGTANCNIIISDDLVGSPVVTEATAVLVMNQPSLLKFESYVEKGGLLLVNSSMVDKQADRTDIRVCYLPVNEIAMELGNPKIANMVLLGAYIELSKSVGISYVHKALEKVFTGEKERFIPINIQALDKGIALAKEYQLIHS